MRYFRTSQNMAGANPSATSGASDKAAQAQHVHDFDFPHLDVEQAMLLKMRERAADRLQLEAQIASDVMARHAQVEGVGGIATGAEALRQVEQKCGEALFGPHRAEQHHDAVVAHDL